MSYNRATKTYRKLLKRLAREFEYLRVNMKTPEDFWAHFQTKHPGGPKYLFDEAIDLAIVEKKSSIEFAERCMIEDHQKLELLIEIQKGTQKPKLQLVKGAA